MAAHRYWRLSITARSGDGYIQLNEINLSKIGETKHAASSVSASSIFSGPASNCYDGNESTNLLLNNTALPITVTFDLGSAKEVESVRILQNNGTRYFTAANVQWSDDNSNWTTAWSISSINANYWNHRLDPNLNKKGLWRWNPTEAFGGTYTRISEIQLRATSGGADLIHRATATEWYDVFGPWEAADNDNSSDFIQALTGPGIIFEISSPQQIREIVIRSGNASTDQFPKSWQLHSSIDGVTWVSEHSVTNDAGGWAVATERTYTFLADPSDVNGVSAGVATATGEISIYGQSSYVDEGLCRAIVQRNRRFAMVGM